MVMPLLHLFGVPATVDGVLITTSNGYFEVAEACSGAKFVIAMVAFGVLVANVCYVAWTRRAAFMAMALVVPVIANGLRAFGTIYAAWWTSVERPLGWTISSMAGCSSGGDGGGAGDRLEMVRSRSRCGVVRSDAAAGAGHGSRRAPVTALLVLTVASLFLGWSSLIAARAAPLPAKVELPQVAGWHRVGPSSVAPWSPIIRARIIS
jgi:exosortase/archaeosortase family protein